MRVQHHARLPLSTRLRRGMTVGLIAAAMAVPTAGLLPVTASAQLPALPALPVVPEVPPLPAAPGAPAVPAVPGEDTVPGVPGEPAAVPGSPAGRQAPVELSDPTADPLTVLVVTLESGPVEVSLDAAATVKDLSAALETETGIPVQQQRLLIKDGSVELESSQTLASYGLVSGDVVELQVA
ncbi:ubiquitin-like domain-containing protein [Nocardia sp. NPDC058640]|uniref:ubiquitin-like domain-containing protein n=1 Tax=Nocardia sp. NPDC058640 TaxID=3346571 RepID=UPI00365F99E0